MEAMDNEGTMEQAETPARPALPLLALLALASALGVAVAVALAGVAMLLAAPAYAEEHSQTAGGLLLERDAGLARAELLFAEHEVLEDGATRIVEAYHNPFGERLAGVYLHRLPPGSVLERLSFTLNARETRHAVLTRWDGGALIERTAQIGPGDQLRVELEYRARAAPRRVLALR
jgi:hypothetical protein